jgi:hypothetical protein
VNWFIIGSLVFLFGVGSVVALWWWKLVARIAPYRDELEREERQRSSASADEAEVVVISRTGDRRE